MRTMKWKPWLLTKIDVLWFPLQYTEVGGIALINAQKGHQSKRYNKQDDNSREIQQGCQK
eukprot:1718412-Ditylum_brightwellii.AAC.1